MKLGGHRGVELTEAVRDAGRVTRTAKASARVADLAPLMADLEAQGIKSLEALAKALNERDIPAAKGGK